MLIAEVRGLGYDYATAAAQLNEVAKIAKLQEALSKLAIAAKWADVNPGRVDGELDYQTIVALAAGVKRIPKIPDAVKTAISVAAAVSAFGIPTSVKNTVVSYADTITSAANALTVTYQLSAGTGPVTLPAGTSAIAPAYLPPGSIQTQIKGQWHTAVPKGSALNGAGLAGASLDAPTHTEAYVTPSPTSAPKVATAPYYKAVGKFWTQWWFWVAAGVAGVAIVTVPIVVMSSRKKRRRR
jgi:hypothetical protein